MGCHRNTSCESSFKTNVVLITPYDLPAYAIRHPYSILYNVAAHARSHEEQSKCVDWSSGLCV